MKKRSAVLMTVLFLAATGLVLAGTPIAPVHKVKHHKKSKKNPNINPQPLPPVKVPVDGTSSNGSVNKAQ